MVFLCLFFLGYFENLPTAISLKLWQLLASTKSVSIFSSLLSTFVHIKSNLCIFNTFAIDIIFIFWLDSTKRHSASGHLPRWEEFIPSYSFSSCEYNFIFSYIYIYILMFEYLQAWVCINACKLSHLSMMPFTFYTW